MLEHLVAGVRGGHLEYRRYGAYICQAGRAFRNEPRHGVAFWRKCDTLPLWRCAELWVRRDRGGRTDRLDDAPGSRRDPRLEYGNGIEPADLARKDCCHDVVRQQGSCVADPR